MRGATAASRQPPLPRSWGAQDFASQPIPAEEASSPAVLVVVSRDGSHMHRHVHTERPRQTWMAKRVPRDEGEVPSPPPDLRVHTCMGIGDGVTHSRAVMAPDVPDPDPVPVPAPAPGHWIHHPVQSEPLCRHQPWLSCGLTAVWGAQAGCLQMESPRREKPG